MRRLERSNKIYSYILICLLFTITACSEESNSFTEEQSMEIQASEDITETENSSTDEISQISETITNEVQEKVTEPIIVELDWSNYFEGINGAAVIYDPAENCYQIYNHELALTRRSPCSTFKIISDYLSGSMVSERRTGSFLSLS